MCVKPQQQKEILLHMILLQALAIEVPSCLLTTEIDEVSKNFEIVLYKNYSLDLSVHVYCFKFGSK